MSKPGTVTSVPNAAAPNAGMPGVPQGLTQIINMRPQAIKTVQGTSISGAPRMILSPAQVVSGVRGGQPGQITLGLQGLPPGAQGHLLVKTENGQLQLLRVNTAAAAPGQMPTTMMSTTAQTAIRLQPPQTTSSPMANAATAVTPISAAGLVGVQNAGSIPAPSAAAVQSQTISADSAKTKCKNFLATLLKLANEQKATVARNVRNLIQGLIDGKVEPEAFTEELQKDLNSSPQPCLVPFLKKTLPYLRLSLAKGELSIDGVRPPPLSSVQPLPGLTTVIPTLTMTRPGIPNQGQQVRLVSQQMGSTTVIQRPSVAPRLAGGSQMQQVRMPIGVKGAMGNVARLPTATTTAPASTASTRASAVASSKAASMKERERITKEKADKSFTFNNSYSGGIADDDINDVAAMGGVNLGEESQKILESTGFVGTQIRSCKDEMFLQTNPLHQRIKEIASQYGLEDSARDVATLISHATQERLRTILGKLSVMAEHRLDLVKNESRYEVHQDIKGQLRFLEDLDRLEKKRKEEQEREVLLRAAKSRSKTEDPEQVKLKAKAKEMQRVEMEEIRQRDANLTALQALQGPKKKAKLDLLPAEEQNDSSTYSGTFTQKQMPMRPRVKRVNLRDLTFLMEQEKELNKSSLLYKSYLK